MSSPTIYTPGRASIIPPNGDLEGDAWSDRAAAHPALILVPRMTENLSGLRPGIEGEYFAPPPVVVAAMYAKQWRIDVAVSGAGVTLSRTAQIEPSDSSTNWRGAVQSGTLCSATFSEGAEPTNFVTLSLSMGSGNCWFSWADKEWWPGLEIFLQTRDFEADGTQLTTALIGTSGSIGGSSTGVEVTFCGHTLPLYYTGSVGPTLSGTIEIRPEDYLTVE